MKYYKLYFVPIKTNFLRSGKVFLDVSQVTGTVVVAAAVKVLLNVTFVQLSSASKKSSI